MYSQDPIDAAIDALNEYSIAIPICEGYQFNLSDMREAMQAAIAAYLDASEITRAELEARCAKCTLIPTIAVRRSSFLFAINDE